ncbi:hypothetical protein ACFOLC_15920 [Lysobacter cavernae]|uniref:DUF1772 domain-containing protein n=1 Tax=Lysobacter cavernae TaxID=1685901 RepID=A0ABV7RUW0_9GAMM
MRKFTAILISSLAAIAVQPFVFIASFGIPLAIAGDLSSLADVARYSFFPALFAIPFVLFVGIPATLILVHFGKLRWWLLAFIGFIAAAAPIAFSGPGGSPGYSSGGNWHGKYVDLVINGEPTLYGWLNHLESIFFFGLHGLVGATVFYVLWRRSMGPNNSFKPNPLRGSA